MRGPGRLPRLVVLSLLAVVVGLLEDASVQATSVSSIEFLGEARIAGGLEVEGSPVGGLSGITFDGDRGVYYVVSDDPSGRSPARFYAVEIDLDEGHLATDGVEVVGVTVIQDRSGGPMPPLSVDPEGIALFDADTLFISSEGQIDRGVWPFVRRFSRNGTFEMELALPDRYRPDLEGHRGPRQNFGFESLTLTPDKRVLFSALENALLQDGPQAALDSPSPSRLLEFDSATGELRAEYLYLAEPVAEPSTLPGGLEVSGLVDLLALDATHLLAMERSFSMGSGNTVRLYQVATESATDVSAWSALSQIDLESIVPVQKELLFDLGELDTYIDNLEGMTFGPDLADGRRTLILVSDDNFNPILQATQFLAFAIGDQVLGVVDVQGAAHRSPLENRWVSGVVGIVTAVRRGDGLGFWMEQPHDDEDPRTSTGILVGYADASLELRAGDEVEVSGAVRERQRPGELSTTTIEASAIKWIGRGRSLVAPVLLNRQGSDIPTEVVEDDGMRYFEPEFDGLDFWESLEGRRVVIPDARVVGPTSRYGDLTIDVSDAPMGPGRTAAGGVLLRSGDANPERLGVWLEAGASQAELDVGARFRGELIGIVDYAFGHFRLYPVGSLPEVESEKRRPERTDLRSAENRLTVATFNVLNLSAQDGEDRFRRVAATVVEGLGSPDIIALQEIQDDSGSADDGTVSATRTLARLIEVIRQSGGPAYEARQIDPDDNQDGGRQGSNIRVALLFDPQRVDFVDRGKAVPGEGTEAQPRGGEGAVSQSPGRLMPTAPAFEGDELRGFSPSRKSLVAEFLFGNRSLVVVNNHWVSKRADSGTFGAVQPPVRASEDQRSQQARLVADFVREIEARHPRTGVIVLGDLNELEFRAPLRILGAAGLENLGLRLPAEDRYTFNYRGNSQLLDHVLVSASILEVADVRVDIVHLNADFAHSRASSDHDPVLVELEFVERR